MTGKCRHERRADRPPSETVTRNGEPTTLTLMERERRYVRQYAGFQKTFYRDFGTCRQLDRHTGEWILPGDPKLNDPTNLATELLAFGVIPDVQTPYGVPRWVNNLPAVMGYLRPTVDQWPLLEPDPAVVTFCERPGYVQIDGGRLSPRFLGSLWRSRGIGPSSRWEIRGRIPGGK